MKNREEGVLDLAGALRKNIERIEKIVTVIEECASGNYKNLDFLLEVWDDARKGTPVYNEKVRNTLRDNLRIKARASGRGEEAILNYWKEERALKIK